MNNTIRLGLILSAIGIITLLLYKFVIPHEILFSWKQMIISLVINIAITIWLAKKILRNPEEGRLGYGQAAKKLFLAYLISSIIVMCGSILLYGSDETMKSAFESYSYDAQESSVRMVSSLSGGSEADQEAAVQKIIEMRQNGDLPEPLYPYTWANLPLMTFSSAITSLILALILALFIREKETHYGSAIDH